MEDPYLRATPYSLQESATDLIKLTPSDDAEIERGIKAMRIWNGSEDPATVSVVLVSGRDLTFTVPAKSLMVETLRISKLKATGTTAGLSLLGYTDNEFAVYETPIGFGWEPPVKFWKEGAEYGTDFDPEDWKVDATDSIYVNFRLGSDTGGTGSQLSPYASIKKALTEAALRVATAINIFVAAGEYPFNNHFSNTACDKDLNIIAVGGRVLCTNRFALTAWTLDGTGTYRATRSGIQDVRDWRFPVTWENGEQTPMLLTQVADLATCQATPGTWYTNNTSVWVHTLDGRLPDAGVDGDLACLYGNASFLMTHNRKWYVEGFDFESANTSLIKVQPSAGNVVDRLVMNDCTVRYQRNYQSKGIQVHSLNLAILHNVRVYECEGDAINYSTVSLDVSPATKGVEINCWAFNSGRPATSDAHLNGSTNHAEGKVVRINCHYRNTYGPIMADIQTTTNWAIGCSAIGCALKDGSVQDASFQALNSAKTWLDECVAGAAYYDLYAGDTAQIRHRNMTITGRINGDVDTY